MVTSRVPGASAPQGLPKILQPPRGLYAQSVGLLIPTLDVALPGPAGEAPLVVLPQPSLKPSVQEQQGSRDHVL